MSTVTPVVLFQLHLDTLSGHLPRVFDGDTESIHHARIATRRLRELLPLTGLSEAHVEGTLRAVGRQLGGVRELDVMSAMLDRMSDQTIVGASVIAAARQAVRERQRLARRAMVKGIERFDVNALHAVVATAARGRHTIVGWRRRLVRGSHWVPELWSRIATRSADAADAVRHATGIYLPNRAHRARIAIKKLRYAVEVAADTNEWKNDRVLRDLRRIQGTLGELHDLQVLADSLNELVPAQRPSPDLLAITGMLQDDVARHHADYLKRRDRVFTIADVCARAAGAHASWSHPGRLVAASVIAVPLFLIGRRHAG